MPECASTRTTDNRYWLCSQVTFSTCSDWSVSTSGGLSGDENHLTWNPHPTTFKPYSDVKIAGDGDGAGLGYATFEWTSGGGILTAEQWNFLMAFFSGSEPTTDVYVRTRTDIITTNTFGEYEYEYMWYTAKMHRPEADPYPPFRYRNVKILFTHAEEAC